MIKVGDVLKVKISQEDVCVLEEVKFVTKQRYMEGVAGESGMLQNVKVPVDTPTFRCRRYVWAAGNSQSRYETFDFTIGELE